MNKRLLAQILGCIWLLISPVWAQSADNDSTEWQPDEVAEAYLAAGKQAMAEGDYLSAVFALDSALLRPDNPVTTTAWYYKGLAWFYAGRDDHASHAFSTLLEAYPETNYRPEIEYHQALIQLDGFPEEQALGLQTLLTLAEADSLRSLAMDARRGARDFLFEACDTAWLEAKLAELPPEEEGFFLEPYCWCMQEYWDAPEVARSQYQLYLLAGGKPLPFLERLFDPRREQRYGDRDQIKIALFLPLFLEEAIQDSLGTIPRGSRIGLDFYEGLQQALDELEPQLRRTAVVRVFDTRRDSATTVALLPELDAWYPDLVVGAVYNTQTEILSDWSERTGTPQIVPFSPNNRLIEGRDFTFLAHPDITVHGYRLAEHAVDSFEVQRVAVFTNQTKATQELADAFTQRLRELGKQVIPVTVDSIFTEDGAKEIVASVRSLRLQNIDAVFIPIFGDQETAGLILSQMSVLNFRVPVLGSPHMWKRYPNIDRELKDRFQLTFSTSFLCEKSDSSYQRYYQTTLREYGVPPSDFHTQGYDLGQWVLTVVNNYPFRYLSLASYLRSYPEFKGLHQNFDFRGSQRNQYVNLGRFEEGAVKKVGYKSQWDLQETLVED